RQPGGVEDPLEIQATSLTRALAVLPEQRLADAEQTCLGLAALINVTPLEVGIHGESEADTGACIEAAALLLGLVITDTEECLVLGGRSVGAGDCARGLIALGDEFVGIETADECMQAVVGQR